VNALSRAPPGQLLVSAYFGENARPFYAVNAAIARTLKQFIKKMPLPEGATVGRDFLMNKFLRNDATFMDKLQGLADEINISLSDEELEAVQRLKPLRGRLVHSGGTEQPDLADLRLLEFIVERLLLARA
jgi:hypothetical protein